MKKAIKILSFCLCILILAGCDRATKDLAKHHLKNQDPISYFHNSFRLEYAENTGAALNLGDSLPSSTSFWLLSILPLLFLVGFFIHSIIHVGALTYKKLFLYALIIAGGFGNIIDRLQFNRHVTDFMNIGIHNLRTGIFNFADLYISIGVMGMFLYWSTKKSTAKNGNTEY